MDQELAEQYEFDLGGSFATLERSGDDQLRTDTGLADDDPYPEIYENAVYGGRADPEATQHFFVYEVEWDDESEPPAIEQLGDELDSVFEGWIVNEDGERVFALDDRADR